MPFDYETMRQIRAKREMTGDDLVFEIRKLGHKITRQTITNYERGKTAPDAKNLALLAQVLGVPVSRLFTNDKRILTKQS